MAEQTPITWDTLPAHDLVITVTAEDIEGAIPGDAQACPIARAMVRITGQIDWQFDQTHIERPDWGPRAAVSHDVNLKARTFDLTGTMEPFEFNLTPQAWDTAYADDEP